MASSRCLLGDGQVAEDNTSAAVTKIICLLFFFEHGYRMATGLSCCQGARADASQVREVQSEEEEEADED